MAVHIQRSSGGQDQVLVSSLEIGLPCNQANHNHRRAGQVVAEWEAVLERAVLYTLVGAEDASCETRAK